MKPHEPLAGLKGKAHIPVEVLRAVVDDSSLLRLTVALYARENRGKCWPSTERIMADTGLGRSAIEKARSRGKVLGLWTVEDRGRTQSVKYHLKVPDASTVPDESTARTRPQSGTVPDADTGGYLTEIRGEPVPVNQPQKPVPRKKHATAKAVASLWFDEDAFEAWWIAAQRVGSKKTARECYQKALTRGATPEQLLASIIAWVEYWESPGAHSRKYPQGWLNQDMWEGNPPPMRKGLTDTLRDLSHRTGGSARTRDAYLSLRDAAKEATVPALNPADTKEIT